MPTGQPSGHREVDLLVLAGAIVAVSVLSF